MHFKIYRQKICLAIAVITILCGVGLAQEEGSSKQDQPVSPAAQEQKTSLVLDVLDLRDMDVNDVFKLLAAKTGLNIIAGKNVQGRVTIYLKNVEVHDVLHIILQANDLAFVEERGIIQVMPEADFERLYGFKFGQATEHKIIALKGIKAADAVALLTQFKSTAGKVMADEQSNTILIEDLPARLKDMEEFIALIDIPTETKVFPFKYVQADLIATRIKEMLTPKLGSVQFDAGSNKVFVQDTSLKLIEVENLVHQLDVPRQTQVFELSYAKAEDMLKTITPMLSKDIGHAEFDARGNKLVVTDIAPKIKEIATVIAALDHKEKEVLIEARIVEIDLTDQYQMGVDWEILIPKFNHEVVTLSDNLSNNFTANSLNLPAAITPQSIAAVGTLNRERYSLILNLLASLNNTKTLSNPQIAVVNNQEAKILIGSSIPYVTDTTTQSATTAQTAESVTMVDVGIKLTVTPTIHNDGYITMKIHPEVSSADKSITTSQKNVIPIRQTSEVDTVIRVKDGVTIMIGGLMKDVATNNKSKIPFLGDIPLFGKAFRNEARISTKQEIVIFLTPHIINGDIEAPAEELTGTKANETYFNPLPKDKSIVPVP